MAITHVCTGACGITAAGAAGSPDQKHWDFGSASGVSVVTDQKPTGTTHAYRFAASAAQCYVRRTIARKVVSGRIYFYMEGFPTGGNMAFIEMICASGNLGCWIIDSAGSSGNTPENIHADVGSGGGQDGPQMTLNTWHYLDFVADTTGSTATMTCKVDGGTEFVASNAQASANMTDIRLGSSNSSTATIWIAAMIFGDATGDYPFGAGTVEGLRPDSDGTHSFTLGDFKYDNSTNIATSATDVWQKLDDTDLQNTTDFVSQNVSRAAGYVEVGFANPASSETPQAVMASVAFHSSGTAANLMGAKLNDGGTTGDITDPAGDGLADVSTTAVQHYSQLFTSAPGGAWTLSRLQGIRARIGFSTDINPVPFCDAIVLEAAFPAGSGAQSVTAALVSAAAAPIAPTRIDQQVTPGLLTAAIAAVAPSIPQIVAPAVQSRPVAPTAFTRIDQAATPAVLSRAVAPIAPRVDQQVVVALQSRPIAPIAPSVVYLVNPGSLSAPVAPVAPTRINQQASPAVIAAPITAPAPTVSQAGVQQVSPGLISASAVAVALARVDQQVVAVLVGAPTTAIAPVINQAGVQQIAPAVISAPASPLAFLRIDQQLAPGLVSLPLTAVTPARVDQQVLAALVGAAAAVVAPGRIDQQIQVTLLTDALSALSPEIQHGLGITTGGAPPTVVGIHVVPGGQAILLLPAGTAINPKPGS